jgi:GT2 family glycosyltransferase
MSKKFSIIIPTIRQTTMVRDCIQSFRKWEPDSSRYEILVVDDGSDKFVQSWLKENLTRDTCVKVFLKEHNRGFSHTVNHGMMNATGEYMVLVNNDIEFIAPWLDEMEKSFNQDPMIAVVGAKLLYPDYRVQHAGVVRWPLSANFVHCNKHMPRESLVVNQSKYYISVTGALYGIRREHHDRVGPFNENYFLACEDTEYSLRVWQAGFRVFYNHKIEALHLEGGTRGNTDPTKIKKGPYWFQKERETFAKFQNDIRKFDLVSCEENIHRLNNGQPEKPKSPNSLKIELACGYSPQAGYVGCDARQTPGARHVFDMSKDRFPFEDSSVDGAL